GRPMVRGGGQRGWRTLQNVNYRMEPRNVLSEPSAPISREESGQGSFRTCEYDRSNDHRGCIMHRTGFTFGDPGDLKTGPRAAAKPGHARSSPVLQSPLAGAE